MGGSIDGKIEPHTGASMALAFFTINLLFSCVLWCGPDLMALGYFSDHLAGVLCSVHSQSFTLPAC